MDDKQKEEVTNLIRAEVQKVLKQEQEELKKELMAEFNDSFNRTSRDMLKKIEETILYNLPLVLDRPKDE